MSKSTEPRGQGIVKDDQTLDKKQRLVEYVEPVVALLREGNAHNVVGTARRSVSPGGYRETRKQTSDVRATHEGMVPVSIPGGRD